MHDGSDDERARSVMRGVHHTACNNLSADQRAQVEGIHDVRAELLKLHAFHWLSGVLHKLEELERGFYSAQTSAVKAIPKALAELDARLQHARAETLPHEPRLAHAGLSAPKPKPIKPESARVPAMPGNRLGHPENVRPAKPPAKVEKEPNLHPEDPREPKLQVAK